MKFKYNETHAVIMKAISDLMKPKHYRYYSKDRKVLIDSDLMLEDAQTLQDLGEDAIDKIGVDYVIETIEPMFPTLKEISKETGIGTGTISKHLKQINLENFRGTAQALTPMVLNSLANNAIANGKAPEVKLFMQIVEQWEEKTTAKNEVTGELGFNLVRKVIKQTGLE